MESKSIRMKTAHIWRWFGFVACLCVAAAFAEVSSEPVILTVLGNTYTASELGVEADPRDYRGKGVVIMMTAIVGTLDVVNKAIYIPYTEKEEFLVTEEELKEFCHRQIPEGKELGSSSGTSNRFQEIWAEWQPDGSRPEMREIASSILKEWKIQKSLFERFGGQVHLREGIFPLAVEATWDYLAEREAAGDYKFHDEDLRICFWGSLREPSGMPLASEEEGREAFAVHPGDIFKQFTLDLEREKEIAPPAPSLMPAE